MVVLKSLVKNLHQELKYRVKDLVVVWKVVVIVKNSKVVDRLVETVDTLIEGITNSQYFAFFAIA